MTITCQAIHEAFPELIEWVTGDETAQVTTTSSSAAPRAGALCFCQDSQYLAHCLQTATCVVIDRRLRAALNTASVSATVYTSGDLQAAMARINQAFFAVGESRKPFDGQRIHPTAVISNSANVSASAVIGPNCVIWDHVVIGEDCVIGSNTTIEAHSVIGDRSHIHANVFIGHHCRIGADCVVEPQSVIGKDGYGYGTDRQGRHFRKPHYGTVVLEDGVEIGSGVYIDRGTFDDAVIGAGTKIDNYCHLGHNIKVGKHCLITAGLITAGSVTIGNHCVFGGRTTISGHLSICDRVQLAGLSGVRKSVTEPGRYGGYPLMPLGEAMKNEASFTHLAEMRRALHAIKRQLGLDEENLDDS